jgi:hypothetical protein
MRDFSQQHGSWTYVIDAGRDEETGKRKQDTRSGFPTRREAEAAMALALAEVESGTWSDDRGKTAGQWFDEVLQELEEKGRSPKTLANYRGHVRDVWRPKIGTMRLRDIRRTHIERVLRELAQPVGDEDRAGNVGRRVATRLRSMIDGYRRTIRALLGIAQRRGLITLNPAQGRMDSIPDREPEEDDEVVWEPEQTAQFLDHVSDDRSRRSSSSPPMPAFAGLSCAVCAGAIWTPTVPACGSGRRWSRSRART